MATSPTPQRTDFSLDILGRYICNGLDEALRSADRDARPDARPFDVVVLGAGTVGGAVAQYLFARDKMHKHRILVLEGGPFLLPEHLQNMPMTGLQIYGPPATSIHELREQGQFGPDEPRDEVWGLPWHSDVPFPGLAYCIGGRSLVWGGWSPKLLESEMPIEGQAKKHWPASTVSDLHEQYLEEASVQLGAHQTNDFIHGELHDALRQQLYGGVQGNEVTGVIPLRQLGLQLRDIGRRDRDLYKLEAPLAVQARTRPGFFPSNKFSSVPLLAKASRVAWDESNNDDVKKRLMVVPNCHVSRLTTVSENGRQRVVGIETNQGTVPVPAGGVVISALGTIESTRLAQTSFRGIPNYDLIGQNFMGHLISMLMIRIPREAVAVDPDVDELQASALFVRGQHEYGDGRVGHFHLQITGTGLGPVDFNAEAELYQKVPDIDTMYALREADDTHVVLVIFGIGEMEGENPHSRITLDPERDEFGEQRAFVTIEPTQNDLALWDTMDTAADDVAQIFANGQPYEVLSFVSGIVPVPAGEPPSSVSPFQYRRMGLGSSHHEAGSLWMGDDPGASVTDPDCRFHYVQNAYAAGTAVLPTGGSAGPVLTGIAFGRRLADHLVPEPTRYTPEKPGFQALFDGFTTDAWNVVGSGDFIVVDGTLESVPGDDLGLYWCGIPTPPDFVLKMEWLRWRHEDNSGIFLRFPNPYAKGYNNPAYVGVDFGFEVQIDELGLPDGADIHKTGAIYGESSQDVDIAPARPPGHWNEFEIHVQGQRYTVFLNGERVSDFENPHEDRGLPTTQASPSFIGLQSYPGSRVAFRKIRIKAL